MLSRFGCDQFLVMLWTVAHQAPLSREFSRQEHWSGLLCPPAGDLPDPVIKLTSLYISCIGRWVLYHESHLGSPITVFFFMKIISNHSISGLRNYQLLVDSQTKCKLFFPRDPQSIFFPIFSSTELTNILCSIQNIAQVPRNVSYLSIAVSISIAYAHFFKQNI